MELRQVVQIRINNATEVIVQARKQNRKEQMRMWKQIRKELRTCLKLADSTWEI